MKVDVSGIAGGYPDYSQEGIKYYFSFSAANPIEEKIFEATQQALREYGGYVPATRLSDAELVIQATVASDYSGSGGNWGRSIFPIGPFGGYAYEANYSFDVTLENNCGLVVQRFSYPLTLPISHCSWYRGIHGIPYWSFIGGMFTIPFDDDILEELENDAYTLKSIGTNLAQRILAYNDTSIASCRTTPKKTFSVDENEGADFSARSTVAANLPHEKDGVVTPKNISEIDKNIPENPTQKNSRRFVCIISNENYSVSGVENVPYAKNDALIFREYCEKTLGIPARNIKVYTDATSGRFTDALYDLKTKAKLFRNAELIFYYSGHGYPDVSNNTAYLLPVDCAPRNVARNGVSLESLYNELGNSKAKMVSVFMDACFSGLMRGGVPLEKGARGVRVVPKTGQPRGNMIVFGAASGDEVAWPYEKEGHGVFTYFLLKKLNETKGNLTWAELGEYMTEVVPGEVYLELEREQNPTVLISKDFDKKLMEQKLTNQDVKGQK